MYPFHQVTQHFALYESLKYKHWVRGSEREGKMVGSQNLIPIHFNYYYSMVLRVWYNFWIDSCHSSCKMNGGPFLEVVARGC